MPGRGAATARRPCRAAAAGALRHQPGAGGVSDARGRARRRHAAAPRAASLGISYVSLYFDITGLGGEETAAVSFLSELLGKVDTAEHPAQELSRLTQLHCGNMSFSVDVYDNSAESYRAKLTARVSALESSIGKALGLLAEVLTGSRLDSEKEVTDILRQKRTGMMQQLMNNGYVSAIGRAGSQLAAGPAANEWANGYDYYCWLKRQNAAPDFAALSGELAALASARHRPPRLDGERDWHALPGGGRGPRRAARGLCRRARACPARASRPAACAGGDRDTLRRGLCRHGRLGGKFDGRWQLAGRVVSLEYLWNAVRVQGGAYGTGMVTRVSGFDGCYSYRDPSAAATLRTYAGAPQFLRGFASGGPDLDGLITGAVAAGEPLLTPRAKGEEADDLYFRGITYEMRRARRAQ
ncbi:MAG: hypothetical protein ACLUEK_15800, partial [Oscillospiraceae bacterium]